MVLLILGAVWAAVLVPPALRARAEASPGDSIGSFHHRLNVLRRTGGYGSGPVQGEFGRIPSSAARAGAPAFGPGRPSAAKRRREVLVALLWVMGGTLLIGLLPGFRGMLVLHLVADVLFAGYVALLLHFKRERERRRADDAATVTRLSPRRMPEGVTDLVALRRAAGAGR